MHDRHSPLSRTRVWRRMLAALLVLGLSVSACRGGETVTDSRQRAVFMENALTFLRAQQAKDGSFGAVQPHLQTGFAVLALLCAQRPIDAADQARLEKACAYLESTSTLSGDLGDDVFRTESHAVCTAALICALEHLEDADLRSRVAKKIYRALRLTQRIQDRSSSSPSRGGWKMEGTKGSRNDRRSSAWALLSYLAARQYGIEVKTAYIGRALHFMMGSFKESAEEADQVGGFSVDTEGLAVASISSMGGWLLARFDGAEKRVRLNLAWLARHPIEWSGPNYFYTNFFRVRALKFSDPEGDQHLRARQRLFTQIKDHQLPSGAVTFPPGNAQNTVAMGHTFSTALAILIVNADHSRLPFDEDYRVKPLF